MSEAIRETNSNATAILDGDGAGAAALVSAGLGSFVLGVLTVAADKNVHIKAAMVWWKPTGPLSGVTTAAILVWLVSWAILFALWKRRSVNMRVAGTVAIVLLLLGFLLTFPPIIDVL
jgi:hypothetical protein